ncbi:hypothetical protein CIHG_07152 [Coccidioides immitis H538.4]|uniref:Uncharacterized protein n=1 Tax=Coccidioides immitis H538.4 TaxID=396776 RepID=A0A0J8UNZ7_COCIT|nr:hypothetical protein CIHG_07152 [Coccidioides immitis H538.4]
MKLQRASPPFYYFTLVHWYRAAEYLVTGRLLHYEDLPMNKDRNDRRPTVAERLTPCFVVPAL